MIYYEDMTDNERIRLAAQCDAVLAWCKVVGIVCRDIRACRNIREPDACPYPYMVITNQPAGWFPHEVPGCLYCMSDLDMQRVSPGWNYESAYLMAQAFADSGLPLPEAFDILETPCPAPSWQQSEVSNTIYPYGPQPNARELMNTKAFARLGPFPRAATMEVAN